MSELSPAAAPQNPAWLDERLEQMDQLLFGLLPRAERLSMVAGLESRLQTLLAADPNLEQAAAKRLETPPIPLPTATIVSKTIAIPPSANNYQANPKRSRIAVTAGILGLVAMLMLFFAPMIWLALVSLESMLSEEGAMFILFGAMSLLVLTGGSAVICGFIGLLRLLIKNEKETGYGWAITGLCSGPLPLLAGSYVLLVVLENL